MNSILDFFALRPIFTLWTVRLVWWLFLVDFSMSFIGLGIAIYQSPVTFSLVLLYLPNLLDVIVRIALVRLFIEMAVLI